MIDTSFSKNNNRKKVNAQLINNEDDDVYISTNNNNNSNNNISTIIEVDNNLNEILDENQKEIDEYADEELEDNRLLPLEINAFEQIKLFLTDSKNFFTATLIENIALLALSNNTMSSIPLQQVVSDTIIIFSQICKNIDTIENLYGKLLTRSTIDNLIIDSINKISNGIMVDPIPYSSYFAQSIFDEVSKYPEYFAEMHIDDELIAQYNKLTQTNIEVTIEYARSIQKDLESKNKILDIVKIVQEYSKFLSRDASKCNNVNEFLEKFSNIINNASSNISNLLNEESSGITLDNVLQNSFYKTIIRSKDDHIKTGLSTFDALTNGGFEKDRVYLLAGKTGGGKSTVLLNLAYGMYKSGNGMFLPEIQIFNKIQENNNNINKFREYCQSTIQNLTNEDLSNNGINKKHMILYVTLENTEYETMKRFMCRMGLISNILWLLIERDQYLSKLVKTKGINFNIEDLPISMNNILKRRLCALSSYINILSSNNRTEFKVWWQPPYSITTYDIFMECKKLERQGYIIDAVFIDYPDKMRPLNSDISKSDQSWDTLGKIIDNLKGFAKQANLPVIGVSQLTREGNKVSGAKNIVIKGGSTAGSQQKESNSDTLINMNIHSKEDNELNQRVDLFKNYQKFINQSKIGVANNLFSGYNNNSNGNAISDLTLQAVRSTDILQLAFSIPDIQSISNYIVKNRDGISDISFETYIVYGMYLVSDYDEEALLSAEYAVDTYRLIIEYMYQSGLVGDQALQVSNGMIKYFNVKINEMRTKNSYNNNGNLNNIVKQPIAINNNTFQQQQNNIPRG